MADIVVYDKSNWHSEHENFPHGLPNAQGGVYCGFALAWFCINNLLSEDMVDDWHNEIETLLDRKCAPGQFAKQVGGVLSSDMLNEDGNRFAALIFESNAMDFYALFEQALAVELPSPYHVSDTWENYDKLESSLNSVYISWKSKGQSQN